MNITSEYKKGFVRGALAAVLLMAAVSIGVKAGNYIIYGTGNDKLNINIGEVSSKVRALEKVINSYYLNDIDEETVEDYIYKGMISGLSDKYAKYYSKEEYEKTKSLDKGVYTGIGITISTKEENGNAQIYSVYEESSAQKAGIQAKDEIVKINDTSVENMTSTDIVNVIKEYEDKDILLYMYRPSSKEYYDASVTVSDVEIQTVKYKMLENNIGYIKITEFDQITLEQFENALDNLEKKNMEGIVFDLRDNPGGSVKTVCSILDDILPEGTVVYTVDKDGNRKDYNSDEENKIELPMAVLVNENSASASEIFAGAVKDYEAATLIGTTTYGKGVVQNTISFNDGSAVKLTVAKYYTPNGNNIDKIGIQPDIQVDDASESSKTDDQLQRAIDVVIEAKKIERIQQNAG